MSKINITFNNVKYEIDEATLAAFVDGLKAHLSTVMNGTGATINLGGTAYSVDANKLATAKNGFVSHLGTVAGDGPKIIVGGTEYSVDSTKVQNAISGLEDAFEGLQSGAGDDGGDDSDNVAVLDEAILDNAVLA